MSFKNVDELKAALAWYKANPDGEYPEPSIVKTFTDDHEACYVIQFGDVFQFTFWHVGHEFGFELGRGNADVTGHIAWNLEDAIQDKEYHFEVDPPEQMSGEFTSLDEVTLTDIGEFVAKYKNEV